MAYRPKYTRSRRRIQPKSQNHWDPLKKRYERFDSSGEGTFYKRLKKIVPSGCLVVSHPKFYFFQASWEIDFLLLFPLGKADWMRKINHTFGNKPLSPLPRVDYGVSGISLNSKDYFSVPVEFKGGSKGGGNYYVDRNFFNRCLQFKGSGLIENLVVVGNNDRIFSVNPFENSLGQNYKEIVRSSIFVFPEKMFRDFLSSL